MPQHSYPNGDRPTKVWTVDGMAACTATHPYEPNYSGHSRGRKTHLEELDKSRFVFPATRCGQRIDEFYLDGSTLWTTVLNGPCRQCFTVEQIQRVFTKQQHGYEVKA